MTPFYRHLSGVPGFGVGADVDRIGLAAAAIVGAPTVAHGVGAIVRTPGTKPGGFGRRFGGPGP